ncbi:unnamed protein product [Rangifer tarandus platyrhynchus]|uniref:Uncharacterized protein n=2 Tax=Rangifer tarandus platyrhynchus TaxID=3082113 RepID=A0ABN9A0S6_RANTA|nr:unnamed protein product [Rangifer tarandus platyrhynchus]
MALVVKNLPANAGDVRDVVLTLGWEDPLEEGMATHFSIFAWRIPWTEEPGGLQFMGSQRVGRDRSDLACICGCVYIFLDFLILPRVGKISWRRKRQATPIFLPGKSHGWRRLVGHSPWGRKESDTTERLHFTSLHFILSHDISHL